MTLIRFKNPQNDVRHGIMPTFLNEFFNDFMHSELMNKDFFKTVPAVNINETADKFVVEIAAPGLSKEDFKVEVEKGVLSIKAEKKEVKSDENSKHIRREFSYSSFNRTFNMPEQVNPDSISAEYENGVLKLQLPKKEEAKEKPVREIAVS
jgi:HSP20 family protein